MLTPLASRRACAPSDVDYFAYCIVEHPDQAPTWIRCGRARLNRDGSVNVQLDALPLSGELHLRAPTPLPLPVRDAATAQSERPPRLNETAPVHLDS